MLHTTQGIKLSTKEYHELHFVVLNDTRFRAYGMTRVTVEKLKEMLKEAEIDIKALKAEDLDAWALISKEEHKDLLDRAWKYDELCK